MSFRAARVVGVVLAPALALALASGTAGAVTPDGPGAGTSTAGSTPLGSSWQRYVVSPSSRDVRPAAVLEPHGDVVRPGGLLRRGGTATLLRRPVATPPPSWPAGTTASASSSHAPNNGSDGQPRSYDAANAIDQDLGTFWNDDTEAAYPDDLTVTAPQATTLRGVTVRSSSDGVPSDFVVQTREGDTWTTRATVTGNDAVQRQVPFDQPVTTTGVRLVVSADQSTGQGEFTRVTELWPGLVEDPQQSVPSVVVDFGKVVVGYPVVRFTGATGPSGSPPPGVRLTFSESREYLTDTSDYTRSGRGGDQHVPAAAGETWTDRQGCQVEEHVCADGLHGFRYLRIALDALPADAGQAGTAGSVGIDAVSLDFTAYLGTPSTFRGWFESSDPRLNRIWYAAAYTNDLTTDHFRADDVDPRGAFSTTLQGKLVLHDGAKRDRDPYVGDLAVQGRTEYLTHVAQQAARNVLADLADHQRGDGFIPPASISHYGLQLFDYPLWWVTSSWDHLLYTGDTAFARRYFPNLQRVLDVWYPSVTDERGLLQKGLNGTADYGDYAFLPRTGEVTYYNVNYVRALRAAARIARTLHRDKAAERWTARAATVATAVNRYLWDGKAGAYLDSGSGAVRHAQDGNAIAVVSGVADARRARQALRHLDRTTRRPWGNAFMDNDTLFAQSSQRVYAFTTYPEVEARFRVGRADSALELIRREWGWMYDRDPGTTFWEGVGPRGSKYEGAFTSLAHGWSTGALPALTNHALGVTPTSAGFARWRVAPQPGDLTWARGRVPTPHGALSASWKRARSGAFALDLTAPRGTRGAVSVPVAGAGKDVLVDGRLVWHRGRPVGRRASGAGGVVTIADVGAGRHLVRVQRAR